MDDEADVANTTKKGLELQDFMVDCFTNPIDALDHYKPDTYNRIVSDIRMPGIGGFDFASRVWAMDPDAQFCFLSAFEIREGEARKVLSKLKSYCFITKPVTPSELAKHLKRHMTPIQ